MNTKECIEAINNAIVPKECLIGAPSTLDIVQSSLIILSSLAVIATAIFAWHQLSHLKVQVVTGKQGVVDQIDSSQANARLTATLNLLTQIQTNPQWLENRAKFIKIRESNEIRKHASKDSADAICVRQQLNQYELIALGISMGILDYNMYKRWFKTTVLRDWTECAPFIKEERKESESYWVELETLIKHFEQDT